MLTLEQQDAAIARLRQVVAQASATVDANTGGFWHGVISGDNGGGERTALRTILQVTIPALERDAARARADDAVGERWIATAVEAERTAEAVAGYSATGTVDQLLKNTAAATASKIADVAADVATPALFGAGLGLVLVALVGVLLVSRKIL